jgi:hypothetical protein
MIEANEDVQELPQPDDSIFSDEDEDEDEEKSKDEDDKTHMATGIRFVASASAASDRDLRGMLSGKQLKLYEKTLVSSKVIFSTVLGAISDHIHLAAHVPPGGSHHARRSLLPRDPKTRRKSAAARHETSRRGSDRRPLL